MQFNFIFFKSPTEVIITLVYLVNLTLLPPPPPSPFPTPTATEELKKSGGGYYDAIIFPFKQRKRKNTTYLVYKFGSGHCKFLRVFQEIDCAISV